MDLVSPERAMGAVAPGAKIVASPGCGEPTTLLAALGERARAGDLPGAHLYSGLLLGDYPFLDSVYDGRLRYSTWHVMPPVRALVESGEVDFYPVRGSQVPDLLVELGIDVALIRITPPDKHGYCSLGPSASYPLAAINLASLVIAEVDPALPRTLGACVHMSAVSLAVESAYPMPEYRRVEPDDVSRAVAKHVLEILPPSSTIQVGIGSISEAVIDGMIEAGAGAFRFVGMGVDGMADLAEQGLLDTTDTMSSPPLYVAELMGTRKIMDFADGNPAVGMFPAPLAISPSLGRFAQVVSINSALEVDLFGQVNAEGIGGRQLSGIGGSVDFAEAALQSAGGLRVIALSSTNPRDGASRIVARLASGTPVTHARHGVDCVVTEYGVARIGHLPARRRAEELVEVAHPEVRCELLRKVREP